MPVAALLSFRLGGTDGVSVVAATWATALAGMGFDVVTVAGEGPVDRIVPGLELGATNATDAAALRAALTDADLVVVENLLTIPMNLAASRVAAEILRGRAALLHHHDPAWQRDEWRHATELPPDDPAWRHVTINRRTESDFAHRGLRAVTIYNGFDVDPPPGQRNATRAALGVEAGERLFAHPVRAIPRKNIPAAVALCEALDATYWLMGPAEDGYGEELATVLARARCRVIHQRGPGSMADAYAAADAVVFPSTWEGFGNPPLEAAIHRRPAAVGHYAVAEELRTFGFEWFDPEDPAALGAFLDQPDAALLEHNHRLVREQFSFEHMAACLAAVLDEAGWLP